MSGLNSTGHMILSGNQTASFTGLSVKDPEPEEKLMFHVKDPIDTFTGRKEFLQKLHESIQKFRNEDKKISIKSQTSFITGSGGIGKSETVRMYIKRFSEEYDSIVWIDAEYPSEIKEQFKYLAHNKLNISLNNEYDKPRKFSHILAEVYEKLCSNLKRLLIIFDSLEAYDDTGPLKDGVRKFLPVQTATIEPPIVLVTSRQQNWKNENVITLDLWDTEECIEHILKRLKLEDTQENRMDATGLAALFGRFPIAVEFAVSLILEQQNAGKPSYCIQDLISDFSKKKPDLLENDQQTFLQATIESLLDIFLDKLKQYKQAQLALRILAFISYLSSTKIPKTILHWLLPNINKNTLDSAIALLTRYSIVQRHDDCITILRVFQDVVIRKLPGLKIPRSKFIPKSFMCFDEITILREITSKLVSNLSSLVSAKKGNQSIISNIIHTAEFIIQNSLTSKFYSYIETVAEFAISIQYKVAIKLYIALIDSDIKTFKIPRRICDRLWGIGAIFYSNGRYKKAFETYSTVLHGGTIINSGYASVVLDCGQEHVLGAHHPDTLTTKSNMALCLSGQGKKEDALALFCAVLEIREKIFGANHQETLSTKNNIAVCLSDQGKNEEALKVFYEVLKAREVVLGEHHSATITTKYNTASCHRDQGETEKALALYSVVLEAQQNQLGALHPDTLTTKLNIAWCLHRQGQNEEAIKLLYVILEERERLLGAQHQETISAKLIIAACLNDEGKIEEALALYYTIIGAQGKVFDALHPVTLIIKHNIAECLRELGKKEEALHLYYTVLEEEEQVLGALHPHTLITKYNVASLLKNQGKNEEALSLYYVVQEAQEMVLGALHPNTMRTKNNIAMCLRGRP